MGEWFIESWESIKDFFKSCINTTLDMLKDLFYFIFETVMDVGIELLNGIGLLLNFDPQTYFSAIPANVANILGLIGLGECLAIISSAIVVRIMLQMIPFVRLGS